MGRVHSGRRTTGAGGPAETADDALVYAEAGRPRGATVAQPRGAGRPSASDSLERFAARFDDLFRTPAQRRGLHTYLRGLLSPRGRSKTLATLARAGLATGESAAAMQRLQYFLCESAWDAERVAARRLELLAVESATAQQGARVLALDAGAAYRGDNGTTPALARSFWADERVCYPLHVRPLAPGGRLAGPVADPAAQSGADAVVALVEAARAAGIAFRAVVCECAPGDGARIAEALQALGVPYVLAHVPASGPIGPRDTAALSDEMGPAGCPRERICRASGCRSCGAPTTDTRRRGGRRSAGLGRPGWGTRRARSR